jgi:hypothetical protein
MKELPHETLQFLAFRAADPIIRHKAAEVLDWLENRKTLPDWGWFARGRREAPSMLALLMLSWWR